MQYLYDLLSVVMKWCYGLLHNYGWAIVLFTFLSKIVLLPVSIWTHLNSIKMIKIQPDINFLKVKYYGQPDAIAEEQAKLFKREKYHPLATIIPTIIQLVLLMGVVGAIRSGIEDPSIDMQFGPVNLGVVPSQAGFSLIWSPIVAGLSSWLLSYTQNKSNVLQSEQSRLNQYGTMALTVVLSLYLGWLVPVGTAFYWVCSNLMAIIQMYILNWAIKPEKYVDYERLEESRKELASIQGEGKSKESYFSPNRKRERKDYKRFFSVVNKHLVFYSESSGFYKYYKAVIEYILQHTNITVHYITSDPNDQVFELEKDNQKLRAYYIGENRLITLMMKMDADIVVMTMPDIETYHIKRSYIRKDIEYIYVQHGLGSTNLTLTKTATDHYDTIFCAEKLIRQEEMEREKIFGVPQRNLVEVGYPLLDEMRAEYRKQNHAPHEKSRILIAPSWQKDNIIDSCLEEILDGLRGRGYDITVRPHPQEVRHKKQYMEALKEKYAKYGIVVQTDFSSNNTVFESDLLITDWSDISFEFAFTTDKPVLFIDTPMKIMNPDYEQIPVTPINILLRDQIGKRVRTDELEKLPAVAEYLLSHSDYYQDEIEKLVHEHIYHIDESARVSANYLIKQIQIKVSKKGEEK